MAAARVAVAGGASAAALLSPQLPRGTDVAYVLRVGASPLVRARQRDTDEELDIGEQLGVDAQGLNAVAPLHEDILLLPAPPPTLGACAGGVLRWQVCS